MTKARYWWMVLVLALIISHDGQGQDLNAGLLFKAYYDDGLDADVAVGARNASARNTEMVDGFSGKGVRIKEQGLLGYKLEENVSFIEGTFSCWLKTGQGEGEGKDFLPLFSVEVKNGGKFWLGWRKVEMVVESGSAVNSLRRLTTSRMDWKADEWHHVALVWKKDSGIGGEWKGGTGRGEIILVVDGKALINDTQVEIPASVGGCFYVGSDPALGRFAGLLDQIRIYKKALAMAEITTLFTAGL